MNIVVLDGYTLNPGDLDWTGFRSIGDLTVFDRIEGGEEEIVAAASSAQIVLTNKTPLSASTIGRLPSLNYIGVLATGYDVVDLEAAGRHEITVTNIPSYGSDSVAQMAFAHLLHHCQRVADHSAEVRSGVWSRQKDFCFWSHPLTELAGRTMGIVGFGRIGRRIGEIARAFGMRVIAQDPNPGAPPEWEEFEFVEVPALLAESDVVSLNCPLTEANRGMINRAALQTMKTTAFLINCSRGPLVVADDLAWALNEGVIAGAGLDVLAQEPPGNDNPLLTAKNCTITPHIAWATREARARLMATAVENLAAYLDGRPQNVVS